MTDIMLDYMIKAYPSNNNITFLDLTAVPP